MAIRRCPYCKAIIDESQKYCNNCGTQLLFPEDDTIEDDIKGEKIVDEDFKDAEEEEGAGAPAEASEDEDVRPEVIDLEDVIEEEFVFPDEIPRRKEPSPKAEEELAPRKEPADEDLPLPPSRRGRPNKPLPAFVPPPPPVPTKAPTRRPTTILGPPPAPAEPAQAPAPSPTPASPAPPPPTPPPTPPPAAAPAPTPEAAAKKGTRDFDLPDMSEPPASAPLPLPGLGFVSDAEAAEPRRDTDTDTKDEIARLISALERKHQKRKTPDTSENIVVPADIEDELPTWSDLSPDAEELEAAAGDLLEKPDAGAFVPGDTSDFQNELQRQAREGTPPKTTIGMPETPVKPRTEILFDREEDEREAEPSAAAPAATPIIRRKTADFGRDEAPPEAGTEGAGPSVRTGLGFVRRAAATVFDVVFVALFWLLAVGVAAALMGTPMGRLIRSASFPLGFLFVVLLAGYLFLFVFFLGETLGGRLLSRRDAA